jgi:hypothetical protein
MSATSRQTVLAIGLAGLLIDAVASHPTFAPGKVTLFKVVTPDDEIVIGLTRNDLAQIKGKTPDAVQKALASTGRLNAWQYGVRRNGGGELEQAPVRRIEVAASSALHVYAFATQLRVLPVAR